MADNNSYAGAVSKPANQNHDNQHNNLEELSSVKPVFILETDLFGNSMLQQKDFLTHEEVYKSIGTEIPRYQMKGLQRVKGMWRIYLAQEEARDHLLISGVSTRNKLLTIFDKNPRIPQKGHKAKECQTPTTTASDTEVNNNDDQSDSSNSESGDETDIGDHVDHSEIPPSQSTLQPTDAITETSTDIRINTSLQKHGKRTATTPTDEYHNRETDSSKASKT
ncbi:unnamed protein product [Mytilus coruscus]|uniref:Uncharacterized protein n=1 Tax=Mytilus coruscus TaxID=42192 RepID=A0A6J8B095_MYTCO|nr:unnamed protein product [Mytilus coruscus]